MLPNILAIGGSLPTMAEAPPQPAFLAGSQIHEKPYPSRMGSQQLAGEEMGLKGFPFILKLGINDSLQLGTPKTVAPPTPMTAEGLASVSEIRWNF